jgi:hypothetical protein
MVSITLSVPIETRELMKQFPEMNWSGFVRKSIEDKAKELKTIEMLKKQFESEKELADWAVSLQKKSRKGRVAMLKSKGIL